MQPSHNRRIINALTEGGELFLVSCNDSHTVIAFSITLRLQFLDALGLLFDQVGGFLHYPHPFMPSERGHNVRG